MRPATQHEAGAAALAAGQLQAARGQAVQSSHFAQHRCRDTGAQGGFHGCQRLGVVAGVHQDQPARIEPVGRQARRMQVAARRDPEHRSSVRQAGEHAGGKAGRDRAGFGLQPGRADFVQVAQRQPAGR